MNPYRTTDGTHRFAPKPPPVTNMDQHLAKIRAALHKQQLTLDEEMEIIAEVQAVVPKRKVIGGWSSDRPFATGSAQNGGYLKFIHARPNGLGRVRTAVLATGWKSLAGQFEGRN